MSNDKYYGLQDPHGRQAYPGGMVSSLVHLLVKRADDWFLCCVAGLLLLLSCCLSFEGKINAVDAVAAQCVHQGLQ